MTEAFWTRAPTNGMPGTRPRPGRRRHRANLVPSYSCKCGVYGLKTAEEMLRQNQAAPCSA